MSKREKGFVGERFEATREDRGRLFSELETKLLAIIRSYGKGALSSKTIKEIESVINEFYGRWKNEPHSGS